MTEPSVDLTKATPEEKQAGPPRPPRTIDLVVVAVCAQVAFSLIRVGSMFGFTDQLRTLLVKSNAKASAKNKKVPYTPSQIAEDIHRVRVNGLWQGLLIAVALLVLAYSLRRTSSATITRWALIVVMVLTGGPFTIVPTGGLPIVPQVASVLSGVASIVAIVALFLPESRAYFKAIGTARLAASGRVGASGRGLAGLFNARPPADRKPMPTSGLRSSAASRGAGRAVNGSTGGAGGSAGARAKMRAEEAAVARGAARARSRAKSSKSRRSEL